MKSIWLSYGRKMGYKPIPGREVEFEKAAEELSSARFSLKFAVFNGTDEDVLAVKQRIAAAEKQLVACSK